MTAKILSVGCPKCKTLEAKVKEVAPQNSIVYEIQKVSDFSKSKEVLHEC